MGDVVLLFAQLDARLGECEGADWIRKRRGTRTVIRRERRFAAVALRGRVRGFGEERAGEVEEAGHAGGAEEERDETDAGVKARRVGSGEGGGAE